MIESSAFVTIGERQSTVDDALAGRVPLAEYAFMRRANTFSRVLAMVDRGLDPASMSAGLRFAVRAYRETWDLDNVYLGEEFPGIQYLAVHAALRRRKRVAMLIHNVVSRKRKIPLGTLRLASMADHLLCLSEQSKRELQGAYGVPGSRITVVGSRVDTTFFTPDATVPQKVQICSAGAINRDYDTLIEAARPLGVPLKIAADTAWAYSKGNAGTTPARPLPDFVEMRSWKTYLNLRGLYAESRVLVVPLARPILSGVTVALEGMAMGKAVIVTHNPYIEEFLEEGESGLFVPAGDVETLRKKLRNLLDHPDEAERLGARARDWVVERFTVARYVDRILSAFG